MNTTDQEYDLWARYCALVAARQEDGTVRRKALALIVRQEVEAERVRHQKDSTP